MKTITKKKLGSFEVKSGKVRITDPCYKLDTWCAGTLKVKKGDWEVEVIKSDEGDWGNRCAVLLAWHSDYPVDFEDGKFEEEFEIGVDSGQAGIFDLKYYKDDQIVAKTKRICKDKLHRVCVDEPWYSICCDRTLSEIGAGVIPFGCVSSSGYGDGGYICSSIRDTYSPKFPVIAIKIDFGVIENEDDN